jgi:hypothetical protein
VKQEEQLSKLPKRGHFLLTDGANVFSGERSCVMLRRSFVYVVTAMVALFLASISSADVPDSINYQGKLTTASGGCLNDTVQMTFTIYGDESGTIWEWGETQTQVEVKEGIFNVLLGSVNPLSASIFDGTAKYLGVQVESDPEMSPLKPIISVAYAYRSNEADSADFAWTAENADLLDGQHASAFLSTANDYGRSGVATDLYEGTSTLTDKYVNVTGPDSVVSASGTAFLGKATGSSSEIYGIKGHGENTSTGVAYGGYFETPSSGTGTHYGIRASGSASSNANTYGVYGRAENSSDGDVYAGYFSAAASGTGTHYGVNARSYSSSSGWQYGVYGYASNSSTGYPKGGFFYASSSGTGGATGLWAEGFGGSSSAGTYGIHGEAISTSSSRAYAASFYTPPPYTGIGARTGVNISVPDSTSNSTYGVYCLASNRSDGSVYGGYFDAFGGATGTGTRYGIYASASAAYGWAGYFGGDVRISDSLVVLGAKSAGVKVDNGEYRLLYSQESPEVWFEDFGEGQLVYGRANIELDPVFAQTVNTQVTYHVFLTPGGDCNGLYVAYKTPTSFEVSELKGGNSNLTFSYRIVAKRKGYENIRLSKMGKPTPEEVAWEQAENRAEAEQEWAKLEEQRQEMKRQREKMEAENTRMEREREQE